MAYFALHSSVGPDFATMPLILMYHSVQPYDEDPHEVTLTPKRFEEHMNWLRRRGLRGVSVAELLSARSRGRARGLIGLTFDDGYQDFVTSAMPILQRFGYTATVFVLAHKFGALDTWNQPAPAKKLMSVDEVRHAAGCGMEIGSHGLDHVTLTDADDAQLNAEVVRSREILEEVVHAPVGGFCYPFGRIDDRVVRVVRDARYEYGCAIWPSPNVGRYALPRTYVHDRDTNWRLDAKRLVANLRVGNRVAVRRHRCVA